MSAAQRSRALDAFTVIRRSASRGFEIAPYSGHYGGELRAAARDLADAAQLTHEPSLERFLSARARALLDDDYYQSDLAFVALQGPIDVVVGPYETDDDEWFGAKTTYEGAIGIVDSAATRQFAALTSRLQELEDSLPLEAPLRGEKLRGGAPILIADSLYQGGDFAAGGAHIAYNLPNDLRVQHAVGARTVVYRNVLRARYDVAFRPISQAMLPPAESAGLTFEDFLSEFVFVRAFDTLGPHTVTGTTRAIADALQENASVAGQIRSMLLSVWGHHYLLQHGYQEKGGTHAVYAAFLVRALSQVRDGVHSEQARGYAYVLNRLLEGGGVRLGENGVFLIDEAQAHVAIEKAAREFVSLMSSGDTAGISAQLTQYAIERPEVQASLQRVAAPSALQRPLFRTADELDPPH
jgi:hypothetical protein